MATTPDLPALLRFAETLADLARPLAMQWFRQPHGLEQKADRSPVTLADRAIEQRLRAALRESLPDHGILGEEEAAERADADWVWVIDPIDGTKAFASGNPLFGTLIGLLHQGEPVLGVLEAPALRERFGAARGHGAIHTDADGTRRRLTTTSDPELAHAVLYHTTNAVRDPACQRLQQQVRWTCHGADCLAYAFLAMGQVQLVVDRDLALHDWCALQPIVTEAGGCLGDWRGAPLHRVGRVAVLAAANTALQQAAIAVLGAEGCR